MQLQQFEQRSEQYQQSNRQAVFTSTKHCRCWPPTHKIPPKLTMTSKSTQTPIWLQKQITLSQRNRGCHLVTSDVTSAIRNELSQVDIGICHIFILHTSAVRIVSWIYNLFKRN